MSSYDKNVTENLAQMNSNKLEWAAVPIKELVETEGKMMPEFDFPAGYQNAPSLYKNNSNSDMCCELCAHPIKTAYWIQNDSKKWVMLVGSECVTHFEAKSGIRIVKEVNWENNRQLLRDAINLRKAMFAKWAKDSYVGYGRYQKIMYCSDSVRKDYISLKNIVDGMAADNTSFHRDYDNSSNNASVTKWFKKHSIKVQELLEKYSELI